MILLTGVVQRYIKKSTRLRELLKITKVKNDEFINLTKMWLQLNVNLKLSVKMYSHSNLQLSKSILHEPAEMDRNVEEAKILSANEKKFKFSFFTLSFIHSSCR